MLRKDLAPAISSTFYERPAPEVARALLGRVLVRRLRSSQKLMAAMIVETEAYLPENDAASHARRGKTKSNGSMFASPGTAYVYPIHAKYCFNVASDADGLGSAVLVRAVEPLLGVELMRRQRPIPHDRQLTNGPAKLCQALAIDRSLDGWDLCRGQKIWIAAFQPQELLDYHVRRSERIGVTAAQSLKLRYYLEGNPFVSGTQKLNAAGERVPSS